MLPTLITAPSTVAIPVQLAANLSILAGALLLEAALGYPAMLFRAIRHPVVWLGALLTWLEGRLNRGRARRARGVLALALLLAAAVIPAIVVQWGLWLVVSMLSASTLFAQRSLWTHVGAVGDALDRQGLTAGRAAVSQIVGRNPETLDAAAVVRAAIESLAENFSDAVVAPAVWCALLGLPTRRSTPPTA
jgi:adenosylcobinamide-phosphate synthase